MKSKIIIIILAGWLTLLSACDVVSGSNEEALEATGVIEAVEVVVAPELAGRVAEVYVSKGDHVIAGDPLFRLEDDLLAQQHNQAAAALETAAANVAAAATSVAAARAAIVPAETAVEMAQAGLATAAAAVEAAQAELQMAQTGVTLAENAYQIELAAARQLDQEARATAWDQDQPDGIDTPPWYFNKSETLAAADAEVTAAAEALAMEQASFDSLVNEARFAEFRAAETRLANAQAAFFVAEELRNREIAQNDAEQIDNTVQQMFDEAQAELEAAQLNYDQQLTSQTATDLLEARARLAAANERHEIAQDRYSALQTGADSLTVQTAAAVLTQAETAVALAEAGVAIAEAHAVQAQTAVTQAEAQATQAHEGVPQAEAVVTLAQKQLAEAQAALEVVELQLQKQVVTTAVAGTIMTRNVQPGELVQPGTAALTIAQLDDLTITVYLPENRYGQVSLGDEVAFTTDSFPDDSFEAVVVRIADQAEYTPRNVQTQEDRQTTVYAVELSVTDPDGNLKPGMPVDVLFGD